VNHLCTIHTFSFHHPIIQKEKIITILCQHRTTIILIRKMISDTVHMVQLIKNYSNLYIVACLLHVRTVEPQKQPSLSNIRMQQ
jgi:hypothetical protein